MKALNMYNSMHISVIVYNLECGQVIKRLLCDHLKFYMHPMSLNVGIFDTKGTWTTQCLS
jgi:hypothetical protein